MLFLAVGAFMIHRLSTSIDTLGGAAQKRLILQVFSGMIFASGLLCFILDENWFQFSFIVKIPLYGILGEWRR